MSYRPLPHCVTIKSSPIDGLGVFATEDIDAETYLGETHLVFSEWDDLIGANKDELYRLELGGYINHSDNPNCYITKHLFKSSTLLDQSQKGSLIISKYRLFTLNPILEGEELTLKYQYFNNFMEEID